MANPIQLPRKLITLAVALPLAALAGYLLATPDQFDSVVLVGLLVAALLAPLVLKWHHALLVIGWQAAITLTFLPGQPAVWIPLSGVSFTVSVLARGLHKKEIGTYVPSIVFSLICMGILVLVTAKVHGGLGLRAMGSATYGGKRYFLLLAAILGYFAFTSQRIPFHSAHKFVTLFVGSSLTALMSNVIYLAGPAFYFLYMIFPVSLVEQQVIGEFMMHEGVVRLTGFSIGGPAIAYIMLARYGVKGIFSMSHPWRSIVLLAGIFITLLGGFRSSLVMVSLLFAIQFFVEGLHRTKLVLYLALAAILLGCMVLPFAQKLPLSVQRSLSILPIDVDPVARANAEVTTEWRLRLWNMLWPQVPQYLFLGKGCAIDPSEMYLVNFTAQQTGMLADEAWILMGAYHSGPLTILIQFGGIAAIIFLWFIVASLRTLYHHLRNGPPELRLVNAFLFSYFAMRTVYFLLFYGHFAEDFFVFTGLIGLSVSINGNVKKAAAASRVALAAERESLALRPVPNS